MADQIETLVRLGLLVFVAGSMSALGCGLTLDRVLAPLRDTRFVATALLYNFVAAPAVAFGIASALSLDGHLSTGLLLLGTAAGGPFLPKLVEVAGGVVAVSIGLMVLLIVASIVYLPVVLPLLLPGAEVAPLDIARPLILLMMLPLAAGLVANRYSPRFAEKLRPPLSMLANVALVVVVVLLVALNVENIVALVGSRGLLAAAAMTLTLFALVSFAPGLPAKSGQVLALGTAQRNISAALVIAGQTFSVDVVTYVMTASLVALLLLFALSKYFSVSRPT